MGLLGNGHGVSSGKANSQHLAERGNFRLGLVNTASNNRGAHPSTSRKEDLGTPEVSLAPKWPGNGRPFPRALSVQVSQAVKSNFKL